MPSIKCRPQALMSRRSRCGSKQRFAALLAWLVLLLSVPLLAPVVCYADGLQDALTALDTRSYDEKSAAAAALAQVGHPRVSIILSALLDGRLYRLKKTGQTVIVDKLDNGRYAITDAANGVAGGEAERRSVKKIQVNNQLRRILRGLVAGLELNQPEASARVEAVQSVASAGVPKLRALLVEHRAQESDATVLKAIDAALVVFDLSSRDDAKRLQAIADSAHNLDGQVRIRLTVIAEDESEDEAIRAAAVKSLASIKDIASRYEFVEILFFGLSLGSVLVLAAIGLSITFGVMGVINMAHGELIMLGAYTTYVVQMLFPSALEYSLLIAVPVAFMVSALIGMAIERSIIRYL